MALRGSGRYLKVLKGLSDMSNKILSMFLLALTLSNLCTFALPRGMQALVDANNAFAFKLYSELKVAEGNTFFSPFSVSSALSLLYEGARGETAKEMRSALGLPGDNEVRRNAFLELYQLLGKVKGLRIANALWVQKGYPLLKSYLELAEKYYQSEVANVDFKGDPEGSRLIINGWVEKRTEGKVKDLIPPSGVSELTKLVVTNAIYFKGRWLYEFNRSETSEGDFWISPGKSVKVPFMHLKASLPYAEVEEAKILELPYEGKELSMVFILPKGDLRGLEGELGADKLKGWLSSLRKAEVEVYLPKFKVSAGYALRKPLAEIGMPRAFGPKADFSGITGRRDIFVDQVYHKAYVEVDEEGTEAAAATAAVVVAVSLPLVFRADHPFLFLIIHKPTGLILFMGRLVNPAK